MIIAQKAGKARVEMEVGGQRTEVSGRRLEIAVNRQNMILAVGRNARPEYVLFGARVEPGLLK